MEKRRRPVSSFSGGGLLPRPGCKTAVFSESLRRPSTRRPDFVEAPFMIQSYGLAHDHHERRAGSDPPNRGCVPTRSPTHPRSEYRQGLASKYIPALRHPAGDVKFRIGTLNARVILTIASRVAAVPGRGSALEYGLRRYRPGRAQGPDAGREEERACFHVHQLVAGD